MWLSGPVTYDQGSITFNKDGTGIVHVTFHRFDFWSHSLLALHPMPAQQ